MKQVECKFWEKTCFACFNSPGTPLQKLQDTVRRQSVNLINLSKVTSESKEQLPVSSTPSSIFPSININYPTLNASHLHQGIPVISSDALKNLPGNVKAIPVHDGSNSFQDSREENTDTEQPCEETDLTEENESSASEPYQSDEAKSDLQFSNTLLKSQQQLSSATMPVDIPYSLLTQIFSGDISLQNRNIVASNNLVGINTEMGTIPVVPVSGKGGLQLIPLEETPNIKETTQIEPKARFSGSVSSTNTTPAVGFPMMQNILNAPPILQTPSGPVIVQTQPNPLYSMTPTFNLSMLAAQNGGFASASALLANRSAVLANTQNALHLSGGELQWSIFKDTHF